MTTKKKWRILSLDTSLSMILFLEKEREEIVVVYDYNYLDILADFQNFRDTDSFIYKFRRCYWVKKKKWHNPSCAATVR